MLTSAELTVVVKELKNLVEDAYVKNVYQTEEKTLVFKLHKPELQSFELLVAAGKMITYTATPYPKPAEPPANILQLRRMVGGLKITALSQRGSERIVELAYDREGLRLVAELMPPGGVFIINDDTVVWLLEPVKSSARTIVKGTSYKPPAEKFALIPSMNPSEHLHMLNPSSPVVASLSRDLGLGGKYAEEVLYRAGVEKRKKTSSLVEEEKNRIGEALKELFEEMTKPRPRVYKRGLEKVPSPVELKSLHELDFEEKTSFSQAVLEAYINEVGRRRMESEKQSIQQQVEALERERRDKLFAIDKLRRRIDDLENFINRTKPLTYMLEDLWKAPKEEVEQVCASTGCRAELDDKTLTLQMGELRLVLRRTSSIHRELGKLYDELKTLKNSLEKLSAEVENIDDRVRRLASGSELVELEKHLPKPTPRMQVRPFREFTTSGGFLVMSGRDSRSNIKLLKQHLAGNDVVFHTEVAGSPATVLKDGGRASEADTMEAAQFTASYSRAWREMFSNASVYYVAADQVSFTPPTGQFLPKGSFMVYGQRRYVSAELRLAAVQTDKGFAVVPYLTGLRSGRSFVELRPGGTLARDAAIKVFKLMNATPSKEEAEMLAAQIPFGRCSVYYLDKLISR
ncbi:MAG: NFACT family protein [Candidatus Caldarchaeum sp.]